MTRGRSVADTKRSRDVGDQVRFLCGQARRYLAEDRRRDALAFLEAALRVPPPTVAAFLTIAEVGEAARAPRLALRALQAARLSFPHNAEPRRRLAQRLLAQQDYRVAALVAVSEPNRLRPNARSDSLLFLAHTSEVELSRAKDLMARHARRTIFTTLRSPGGRVEFRAFADRAVVVSVDCRRALFDALRLIDETNRDATA